MNRFVIYQVLDLWQVIAPAGVTPSVKHFRTHADAIASIPSWGL